MKKPKRFCFVKAARVLCGLILRDGDQHPGRMAGCVAFFARLSHLCIQVRRWRCFHTRPLGRSGFWELEDAQSKRRISGLGKVDGSNYQHPQLTSSTLIDHQDHTSPLLQYNSMAVGLGATGPVLVRRRIALCRVKPTEKVYPCAPFRLYSPF